MKNIKSVCLFTVCLCAANTLFAQQAKEIKTEIAKPLESKVPAPGSKPVLATDAKPQPVAEFREMPKAVVYEAPSPFKKDDTQTTSAVTNGEKLKPIVPVPITDVPQVKPQAVLTPAAPIKVKEN